MSAHAVSGKLVGPANRPHTAEQNDLSVASPFR